MSDEYERLRQEVDMQIDAANWWYEESERLREALMALVDALHDPTPDGPTLIGRAEEAAIRVLGTDVAWDRQ